MNYLNWEQLVRDYQGLVWTTVRRLVDNETDAADCFQETFVKAVEMARRQRIHHMPALLTRIATARAIDHLRGTIRQRQFKLELEDQAHTEAPGTDPAAGLEQRELAQTLRKALGILPRPQAQAFCLKHLSGWTQRQIALELETTTSAVGVMIHRAKKQLRASLDANGHPKTRCSDDNE